VDHPDPRVIHDLGTGRGEIARRMAERAARRLSSACRRGHPVSVSAAVHRRDEMNPGHPGIRQDRLEVAQDMSPAPILYRLRGTDFAVDRPHDLLRLAAGVAWLTGPAARRVVHAGPAARRAERSWARSAARWLRMRLTIAGSEHIDPART
jgi:hypothetical protein